MPGINTDPIRSPLQLFSPCSHVIFVYRCTYNFRRTSDGVGLMCSNGITLRRYALAQSIHYGSGCICSVHQIRLSILSYANDCAHQHAINVARMPKHCIVSRRGGDKDLDEIPTRSPRLYGAKYIRQNRQFLTNTL